jgi:hypothetical protein
MNFPNDGGFPRMFQSMKDPDKGEQQRHHPADMVQWVFWWFDILSLFLSDKTLCDKRFSDDPFDALPWPSKPGYPCMRNTRMEETKLESMGYRKEHSKQMLRMRSKLTVENNTCA